MKKLTLLIVSFILPYALIGMDPHNTQETTTSTIQSEGETVTWDFKTYRKMVDYYTAITFPDLKRNKVHLREKLGPDYSEKNLKEFKSNLKKNISQQIEASKRAGNQKGVWSPLFFGDICKNEDEELALELIETMPEWDSQTNAHVWHVVNSAIENNLPKVALKVIEKGHFYNFSIAPQHKPEPINLAAKYKLKEVVALLLNQRNIPLIYIPKEPFAAKNYQLGGNYAWKNNWDDLYIEAIEKGIIYPSSVEKNAQRNPYMPRKVNFPTFRTKVFSCACKTEKKSIALALIEKGINIITDYETAYSWNDSYSENRINYGFTCGDIRPLKSALDNNLMDIAIKLLKSGEKPALEDLPKLKQLRKWALQHDTQSTEIIKSVTNGCINYMLDKQDSTIESLKKMEQCTQDQNLLIKLADIKLKKVNSMLSLSTLKFTDNFSATSNQLIEQLKNILSKTQDPQLINSTVTKISQDLNQLFKNNIEQQIENLKVPENQNTIQPNGE